MIKVETPKETKPTQSIKVCHDCDLVMGWIIVWNFLLTIGMFILFLMK